MCCVEIVTARRNPHFIMAGPVPAIHVLLRHSKEHVDARHKAGHDCGNQPYELTPRTVTARRFCDQQEISLQTATGRSLPYDMVRMRCGWIPRCAR